MSGDLRGVEASTRGSEPVWLLSLAAVLPCMGVLAGYFVNHDLLLLVYFIVGLTVFVAHFRLSETFADWFFPIFLVSIALSLLLSGALINDYIPHSDMLGEYTLYLQTLQVGFWQSQTALLYNSALSVTVLPLIFSKIASIQGSFVFRVIYPCLFAIVPLVLYRIYRKIVSPTAAFISVFVFLSFTSTYFEMLSLGRQMVGELIMILLLWLLLTPRFRKNRSGAILVVLLTTGLVMSHYSLALIYLGVITFSYILSRVFTKFSDAANSNLLVISIVTAAAWFLLAAGGIVLHTAINMSTVIVSSLADFFTPGSRPGELYSALGTSEVNYSFLHLTNRGIQYLVLFCIIVGFVTFVRRKPSQLGREAIIPLMTAAMFLLVGAVALPFVGSTLKITRIYSISLLFLSPCFYFGTNAITSVLGKIWTRVTRNRVRIKTRWLVPSAILFLYLIFTSGWVWAVTSDTPTSLVLDLRHMANYSKDPTVQLEYYGYYIQSQDVAAGIWIKTYGNGGSICADEKAQTTVVILYGGERQGPDLYRPQTCGQASYVYVSVMNSVIGLATSQSGQFGLGLNSLVGHETYFIVPLNQTTAAGLPSTQNRIFSDGGTFYNYYTPTKAGYNAP